MASLFTMLIAAFSKPANIITPPEPEPKRTEYMDLSHNQEQALAYLAENLNYNPVLGEFMWARSGKGRMLGIPAGAIDHSGYLKFSAQVGGKRVDVKAQRLAVYIMSLNNYAPPLQANTRVGFADGDRLNLVWSNIQIL